MEDEDKTKEKLIRELTDLHRRLIELESSDTKQREMLRDLKKSEEKYRLLVDSSSDFIWEVDANGIYTYANPKVKDLLGYEPEEIIGKTPFDFMPAHEAERVARLFKDIFESQKPFQELENTNLHKDGHHVVLDTSGVPIFDTNGNLSGYRGIDRDISERKKIEEAMKHTKDFSDNIIEGSLDCIVISDRKGYLTRVNKYFLELLGYKKEEVLGKHIAEFAPPEEGTYELITGELINIDKDFFENQLSMMCLLVEKGKVSNWDAYYCRKDRKLIPIEQNIVYLYDKRGEKTGSVGISRDVTERRKAAKEIVEARDFLENVFNTSVDGIITTDWKGSLTMANRSAEEILGYETGELVGKHPTELNPKGKDCSEEAKDFMTEIMEEGFVKKVEQVWVRKDRTLVNVELNAALLKDSHGEITGSVASVRDITDRKKTEKRLNNYQNQLRSLASQLTLTEERARRHIATDLHDRIGQALAMTKIKLGSLRESASSIGLGDDVDKIRDLIEQSIQDTRSLIFDICPPLLYELGFEKAVEWLLENIQEQHGIDTLFKDDGIPKPLDDDMRVLLYQTVRELLMNIVKHAQAKKVRVSFKGNRGYVKISVEDDGIGFDPSKISSRVGKPEGFGLFRIVERLHYLGGEIQFESKPHHGTKISMVVPTEQSGQTRKEELK